MNQQMKILIASHENILLATKHFAEIERRLLEANLLPDTNTGVQTSDSGMKFVGELHRGSLTLTWTFSVFYNIVIKAPRAEVDMSANATLHLQHGDRERGTAIKVTGYGDGRWTIEGDNLDDQNPVRHLADTLEIPRNACIERSHKQIEQALNAMVTVYRMLLD